MGGGIAGASLTCALALAGKEVAVLEASFEFQEPWRDARIVRGLILTGAARQADFVPYGAERLVRMRTLRLLADVVSVTFAVDAGNRPARRAWKAVPADLVDDGILDRILGARW